MEFFIDGKKIQVYETGMELFGDGWDWDYAYDKNDQGTYVKEIDDFDFDFELIGYVEIDGIIYNYYDGDFGTFLLNEDGNFTVFLAIKNGEVVGVFETEEEAEKYLGL